MASMLHRLGLVAVVLWAAPAAADSGFRCGRHVVGVGDHMRELRDKCGEPAFVSQRFERRTIRQRVKQRGLDGRLHVVEEEREVEVAIDEWVYDLGDRRFVRYVAFENGRVVDVDTGNKGAKYLTAQ